MRERVSPPRRSVNDPASSTSGRQRARTSVTATDRDARVTTWDSTPAARARILLIEDELHAREALALLLEYYGYEVFAASNGTDALELVTEMSPDLVVTDWRMPGLSGRALCVALRERRHTLPIIVVTSAEEVFQHDQPVNARLRKPIDPSLLNYVIAQELQTLAAHDLI